MQISTTVAYRVYRFQPATKAIAFNTHRKQFMFLEGLSADLLDILLSNNQEKIDHFLIENNLSSNDLDYFIDNLRKFGFYASPDENQIIHTITSSPMGIAEDPHSKHALNLLQNELRMNGMYYNFHLDLTNRCNEKCIHCYHPFDKYDYSKELTLDDVKELIDTVYALGVFVITLSGGECLLRKDFFEILKYISDKGMMTIIFTNGLLLTEETVQQIKKYRVKMVSISLYGDTSEIHDKITNISGSFDCTMEGIERLKKYDIPFELKCIVLKENINRVEQVRALSKKINNGQDCKIDFTLCGKLDGDCDIFSHRASQEKIKEIFYSNPERYFGADVYLNQLKTASDSPCGAGKYGLYCSAEGNIYPCVSFRLLLCHYKDLLHINDNPVLLKWKKTKISDFTDCFKHDYCRYCTEQCAGNNLIENGNYLDSRSISNCERAKIIAEWFQTFSENNK